MFAKWIQIIRITKIHLDFFKPRNVPTYYKAKKTGI